MAVSKNKLRAIRALEHKKKRDEERLFIAEGPKVVGDLLEAYEPHCIIATADWLNSHRFASEVEVVEVTPSELCLASLLQHPRDVLAVMRKRGDEGQLPQPAGLMLALDGVQDPGNLGTIIRIADWFGIRHIVCDEGTVDAYNPKVVQASMGSLARVRVCYTDLADYLGSLPADFPVYGTTLGGASIYKQPLSSCGIIVMGNEAVGISGDIRRRLTRELLIPHYPADSHTVDSLNVAIATAIVCAEFRRK